MTQRDEFIAHALRIAAASSSQAAPRPRYVSRADAVTGSDNPTVASELGVNWKR